jgi:Flp pilus assembly pilin Flp
MPRGPLPLRAHQAIEPFAAILLIAAPWIFGFSDNDTAMTLSVIAGIVVLATGMTTRWRMSLVKLIPLRTHFMMDVGLGIALIALPFIAGFSDDGGATRFFVIAGALELGTALMTRWDEREEVSAARGARTTAVRQ